MEVAMLFRRLGQLLGLESKDTRADERAPAVSENAPAPAALPEDDADAWWLPQYCPTGPAREPGSTAEGHSTGLHSGAEARWGPAEQESFETCAAALRDPNIELPQLQRVAQQLLVELRSDDVDLPHAAQTAAQDPSLAADVLRLANSAAFGGTHEIRRLEQAFIRLGRRRIQSLTLAASLKSVSIHSGGAQRSLGEELWQAALASAVILERVAGRVGLAEEDAFLIGLLHDIGLLAVLRVTSDCQLRRRGRLPRSVFERLGREWHEAVGRRLAEAWKLPHPLPELIGDHHCPPADEDPLRRERLLLAFADSTVARLGYGLISHLTAGPPPGAFLELPCVRGLGFDDGPDTRALLAEFPRLLATRMSCD